MYKIYLLNKYYQVKSCHLITNRVVYDSENITHSLSGHVREDANMICIHLDPMNRPVARFTKNTKQ